MTLSISRAVCVLAMWPAMATANTFEAQAELTRRLNEQRPDVQRWETRPVDADVPTLSDREVVSVGRVAARMPVRFADGRVRWYSVAGFRSVTVARHAIEPGAAIDAAATEERVRDVIAQPCEPVVLDPRDRWRAKRRLATGDAVCAHTVERLPEVARDQAVMLRLAHGAVSVSRRLIATADARAGERVRLRDSASGATLMAIVTGPGAARLVETP